MYKLKLNYTEDELRELKGLEKTYDSPMYAISKLLNSGTSGVGGLQAKYLTTEREKEFDLMADINNVIMGTAAFPKQKYVVYDNVTNCCIWFDATKKSLCWGQIHSRTPEMKTKDEWLAINPAYEPMLKVF